MKKINIFSLCLGLSLSLSSCTGFLKEAPTTSLSETSVYNSESALESQIYGVLSSFYGT